MVGLRGIKISFHPDEYKINETDNKYKKIRTLHR